MKLIQSIFVLLKLLVSAVFSVPVTNVVSLKGVLEAANLIRANPKAYATVIQTEIRSKMTAQGLHEPWGL